MDSANAARVYLDALTRYRSAMSTMYHTSPVSPAYREAATKMRQCWIDVQTCRAVL